MLSEQKSDSPDCRFASPPLEASLASASPSPSSSSSSPFTGHYISYTQGSPIKDFNGHQSPFLCAANFEQSGSDDSAFLSPVKSPIRGKSSPNLATATVIPPPHLRQHSRSSSSSSSISSSPTSPQIAHSTAASRTIFPSQTKTSFQQQQRESHPCPNFNKLRLQSNNVFDINNNSRSSAQINNNNAARKLFPSNQTCNDLDLDLLSIQTFDWGTNINRNNFTSDNANNNNSSSNNYCVQYDRSDVCDSSKNHLVDNHSTNLPPVTTFLGTPTPGPLLSDIVTSAMLGDDDGSVYCSGSRSSSCSSMEEDEQTSYTDLMNVTYENDLDYGLEEPGMLLQWHMTDIAIKSEPTDPLYPSCMQPYDNEQVFYNPKVPDSPSGCSEGYGSEYNDNHQQHYYTTFLHNANIVDTQPPPHRQVQDLSFEHFENSQSSPLSDEGFYEEQLPDFAKLQQHAPMEPERAPQRRRSSASSQKEKKKVVRDMQPVMDKERRKPGRKPGQVSNVLHLWEFMRDLLQSPENHGIIEWISKPEGVFRVVNSTEVARLWGEKKKNKKKMTYEKLSRSLRYSRLEGYFSDLPKDKNYPKKLCFKFGPKSKDWH